jgi:hypothetical protein
LLHWRPCKPLQSAPRSLGATHPPGYGSSAWLASNLLLAWLAFGLGSATVRLKPTNQEGDECGGDVCVSACWWGASSRRADPLSDHVEERLSMAVRSVATSVPVIDRERHAGGVSPRH